MSINLAVRAIGYNDADLAALAEHIESRAWTDIVAAAPPWLRQSTGLRMEEVGGVVALIAPSLDSLLFNRVIGLGEHAPATHDLIRAVIDRYLTFDVQHYWVHAGPYARPARLGGLLQENGLEPYQRSWVKMIRPARHAVHAQTALNIRLATVAEATTVASIVGPGFDLPQHGAELFAGLVGRRRWQVFVAETSKQVVAAAGMFIEGDVAYLCFASTLPQFRRQGAQRALMEARINVAVAAGCHWIATETGFPLAADEPNASYQNMLWAGFRPVAIRDNYAPAGTQWSHAAALA